MRARNDERLRRTVGVVLGVWPGARDRVEAEAAAIVCVTRCAHCLPDIAWEVEATVVEGAALLRAHIAARHPDVPPPVPQRRGRPKADTTGA